MKPWRVGRKVGRTIYEQQSDDPADGDRLIGLMDTRELAAEAVRAHNAMADYLERHDSALAALEADMRAYATTIGPSTEGFTARDISRIWADKLAARRPEPEG